MVMTRRTMYQFFHGEIERGYPIQQRFRHRQNKYSRHKRWLIFGKSLPLSRVVERWGDADIWLSVPASGSSDAGLPTCVSIDMLLDIRERRQE